MDLPFIIDIALGLIFIFLILSLLASELQELLTTLLQWRARHLKESIEVLLAGGTATPQEERIRDIVNKLYDDPLIKNSNQEAKGLAGKARIITRWLFPDNQRGRFFGTNQATGPSYIAPETFATSLMERIGLAILVRKLMEVRLKNFATRIIGVYQVTVEKKENGFENRIITIPPDDDPHLQELWKKGRIRLIAEKAHRTNLNNDRNFQILVEEFDDILDDFNRGENALKTAVERMGESLNTYMANYPLPESENSKNQATIPSIEDAAATEQNEDLIYFANRLTAFKRGIFGEKSERAIDSGGLRPSLLEIAELINQSSNTYKEVARAYEEVVEEGKKLDENIFPFIQEKVLEEQLDTVAQQLVKHHLNQVEQYLEGNYAASIQPFQKQLKAIAQKKQVRTVTRKSGKRKQGLFQRSQIWFHHQWHKSKFSAAQALERRHQEIILGILDQLPLLPGDESEEQPEAVIRNLLNSDLLNNGEKLNLVDHVLDQLASEDRQLLIDTALSMVGERMRWNEEEAKHQRSLYQNYQNYKTTQQVLKTLPNSIKESFAILARRAQTRVEKQEHQINQFREEIAIWFDRSMERASGVYKRNAKGVAILIGLLLVMITNVDAGFIVDRLSNDENLRTVIANRASETGDDKTLDQVRTEVDEALKELALPIGWNPGNVADQLNCSLSIKPNKPAGKPVELPSNWAGFYKACLKDKVNEAPTHTQLNRSTSGFLQPFFSLLQSFWRNAVALLVNYPLALLRILMGWLIAGIAIAMGAPFWFDLLGKLVNVRNAGSKPASSEHPSTKSSQ